MLTPYCCAPLATLLVVRVPGRRVQLWRATANAAVPMASAGGLCAALSNATSGPGNGGWFARGGNGPLDRTRYSVEGFPVGALGCPKGCGILEAPEQFARITLKQSSVEPLFKIACNFSNSFPREVQDFVCPPAPPPRPRFLSGLPDSASAMRLPLSTIPAGFRCCDKFTEQSTSSSKEQRDKHQEARRDVRRASWC